VNLPPFKTESSCFLMTWIKGKNARKKLEGSGWQVRDYFWQRKS
jgi:hypothetical protein